MTTQEHAENIIVFYDTRLKKKTPFIPIQEQKARIYVCGPTVYDDAHLGHARSAIVFDVLRRMLLASGYEVCFVRNITDIDDKIIQKAHRKHIDIATLTQGYITSYKADMKALSVLEPDKEPRASLSLESILHFIETLLQQGIAYQVANGDVYFHVASDAHYGSISSRGVDDENQARIHNDEGKQDERDFALWKAYKGEHDIGFDSAFGRGRPGWHIECSAMIEECVAYKEGEFSIDIHGGGSDLLFPHHENEAAQTRCALGREIAKYWIHNGFVNINGEKMSKSLGNSFFIKDAIRRFGGEVLRNYLLGAHYRAVLHFDEQDILMSKKRLDKIYRLKQRVLAESSALDAVLKEQDEGMEGHMIHDVKQCIMLGLKGGDEGFCKKLLYAMYDDMNIAKAFSVLEEMISSANAALDATPKDKALKMRIAHNLRFIIGLFGLGGGDSVAYFQQGVSDEEKAYIQAVIAQRLEAKRKKDFASADALREELYARGIMLQDTPEGCIWEKIEM